MNQNETELIFKKILQETLELNNNSHLLLQKFAHQSTNMIDIDDESRRRFITSWYQKVCASCKNHPTKATSCIFAMYVLEALFSKDDPGWDFYMESLLPHSFVPLHQTIVTNYFIDSGLDNGELLITFYRMHLSCARKNYTQFLKRYNLWKPLLHFYLKNDKFHFLIQNMCTDYVNLLAQTEESQVDLRLYLEIINLITRYIKSSVQNNCINNQTTFKSLRLLDSILSKNISHLNSISLTSISKTCHSLTDLVWLIATTSNVTSTIKYSLKLYVLLKIYISETNEYDLDIVSKFINIFLELITNRREFTPFVPDVTSTFDNVWKDSNVYLKYQQCFACILVATCWRYLQLFLPDLDERDRKNTPDVSESMEQFCMSFQEKLQNEPQLSSIVKSTLKIICDSSSHLSAVSRNYLLHWLVDVLKSFSNNETFLNDEACQLLLNIVSAVSALLDSSSNQPDSEELTSRILEFIFKIDQMHLQQVIRLAVFRLCDVTTSKMDELNDSTVELLTKMISKNLDDENWEIRDSTLEILNKIICHFISNLDKSVMNNPQVCRKLENSLTDSESFVRASGYVVLSTLIRAPDKHLRQNNFNYEHLLMETLERFFKETEFNVRHNMMSFIQEFWQNQKIINVSISKKIFDVIYYAIINDLNSEVRFDGIIFWENIFHKIYLKRNHMSRKQLLKFLHALSYLGFFRVIANIMDDEYNLKVIRVATRLVNSLKSLELNEDDLNNYEQNDIENLERTEDFFFTIDSVNAIPVCNTSTYFTNVKSFFEKYCWITSELVSNEITLDCDQDFVVEDLLDCFTQINFGSEVNEKDCY